MNDPSTSAEKFDDLLDGYLAGSLSASQFARLEALLLDDASARRRFVLYCRTDTDLHVEVRARRAADRAVAAVVGSISPAPHDAKESPAPPRQRRLFGKAFGAAAAILLLAMGATWWVARRTAKSSAEVAEVAWLANAQDCHWGDAGPSGGLKKGAVLRLDRGLAEVRFRSGANVVLEGPTALELLSGNSARLLKGKLSARVPETAKGFQVLAPQGRVVDLGTEFGLAVSDDGSADVVVFKGKVEAYSKGNAATPLTENRTARISSGSVVVDPRDKRPDANEFTRQIRSPAVVPRTLLLDFRASIPNSLRDATGVGTGLETRLPGTGSLLPLSDPNLRLNPSAGGLELMTTRSDINQQFRINEGEYLGAQLSKLGFTGKEDFEITAIIPNIPSLAAVGQFGLYAGASSERNIRGGLISRGGPNEYRQFLVNNVGGHDHDALYVGIFPTGSDVQLTLRREHGKYAMSVESLSAGAASTLSIRHSEFLDAEKDLYVGLFAANTGSEERRKMVVKQLKVTVWAVDWTEKK